MWFSCGKHIPVCLAPHHEKRSRLLQFEELRTELLCMYIFMQPVLGWGEPRLCTCGALALPQPCPQALLCTLGYLHRLLCEYRLPVFWDTCPRLQLIAYLSLQETAGVVGRFAFPQQCPDGSVSAASPTCGALTWFQHHHGHPVTLHCVFTLRFPDGLCCVAPSAYFHLFLPSFIYVRCLNVVQSFSHWNGGSCCWLFGVLYCRLCTDVKCL